MAFPRERKTGLQPQCKTELCEGRSAKRSCVSSLCAGLQRDSVVVQEATKAVSEMDNHKLDKMHLVRCYRVDELDRLRNVPEEYVQPEKSEFDKQVRHFLDFSCT